MRVVQKVSRLTQLIKKYIRGVSQKFLASYIMKHNTAPLTSWCFYVISESFKVLIPWFLQLLYSKRRGKLQHGFFLLSIHLPTLPRCCDVCCGWMCLRIISPSTILARSNSLWPVFVELFPLLKEYLHGTQFSSDSDITESSEDFL